LLVIFIVRVKVRYGMQKDEDSTKSAKEIVMEFVDALERKDFKTVRSHISDNISVLAPGPVELTRFNQAEPYVTYLEHANLPRFEIKKEFEDNNDICLLYEMNYREPPVMIFVCAWFQVNDYGKIGSIRFIADIRTLLEQKK
jgi:limonene-1,2-epoxide hydrolase